MAYAVPTNFAAGAVLTEAQLDVLGNDIIFLANPPKCRVYNSAAISITTSGADQALTFNSERFDADTMHSTSVNTGRITFTTAGTYDVGCAVGFAGHATGRRTVRLRVNGTTVIAVDERPAVSSGIPDNTAIVLSTMYAFSAGDYVEVVVQQTSGGALNVFSASAYSPEFWAIWRSL